MVDLSNLFTQITASFTGNSSVKMPSPFSASKEDLNFTDYQDLNNNKDEYINKEQQKKMQELLAKAKSETGTDKEKIASDLYQGLLALKGNDDKSYELNSKEFLQNFNALVSQVKNDPALVNELRKSLVNHFGKHTDEERKLGADARKEWYEISYENSLDKLKAKDTTYSGLKK